MSGIRSVVWILAITETIHNLEEAIWLPAWSQGAGVWHPSVGAFEFRFAVAAITLLFYGVIFYFSTHDNAFAKYLFGGALVMIFLNVFIPHLVASIVLAQYAPGVISGIVLNLPATVYLLRRGIREGVFVTRTLVIGALGFALVVAPLLPVLFAFGRFVAKQFGA